MMAKQTAQMIHVFVSVCGDAWGDCARETGFMVALDVGRKIEENDERTWQRTRRARCHSAGQPRS
ncbi:hypothetical protein BTH42_26575 [Burkholderia sp. SRS-W-2-2016]|nr:hypothetical protein BTH42_26575 [Burkholderia sp. SRS-W-2-2016]